MSQLAALKSATSLLDVANILDTEASGLAYVLYKLPDAQKYREFEIEKRYGGTRKICAPCDALRLLQQRLSALLQNCLQEIEDSGGRKHDVAHGFKRRRDIMTNGAGHRKQRYVFNIDLKDFFPSINFGRVRGFFIKDRNFALNPKVATFIAQVACFKNGLPQGSPSSPVISNLVAHVLDTHLVRLAARQACQYTRYADDLTFSSNQQKFPAGIAKPANPAGHEWVPSVALANLVAKCGFQINSSKTRMQYCTSRQEVTGLVVNRKVNVRSDYRRIVRAMTHHLITKGVFELRNTVFKAGDATNRLKKIGKLHGRLAFIDQIDLNNHRQANLGQSESGEFLERLRLDSKESVYRQFLLFTRFYDSPKPVVLCEGSTDNVYLVHAVRSLVVDVPILATKLPNGDIEINVRFHRYFKRRKKKNPTEHSSAISSTNRILKLKGGSGELLNFAKLYREMHAKFKSPGGYQPIILLVDNDDGAKDIFSFVKGMNKACDPKHDAFVHLFRNLYLVATPLTAKKPNATVIEDFFTDDTKMEPVNGKPFDSKKEHEDETSYGKAVFAHRVVRPKADSIDFSNFKQFLLNISAAIEHHRKTHLPPGKSVSSAQP